MKEKWEEFRVSLSDTTSMSKREFLLTVAVCILGGIVFGMFCSPRKSTVIGSNNGNNSGNANGCSCEEDNGNENEINEQEDN